MIEWAEWRDKQNFAIILQTEAAELAWNHKQTEVDQLKDSVFLYGRENTKLQIQRNALQAEVERYREAICIYMRDEHEHHEDEITNDDEAIERFLLDYLEPTTDKDDGS